MRDKVLSWLSDKRKFGENCILQATLFPESTDVMCSEQFVVNSGLSPLRCFRWSASTQRWQRWLPTNASSRTTSFGNHTCTTSPSPSSRGLTWHASRHQVEKFSGSMWRMKLPFAPVTLSEPSDWEKETETTCCVEQGGIMLMKPLTLHSSGRTTNNKKRRAIHIEFSNMELPATMQWAERININWIYQ